MREQQIAQMVETSEVKNFKKPDEVREFLKGRLELLRIGGVIVGRAKLEPGWKWTESLQSEMGTDSCEAAHFQYFLSGTLRIRMDDGRVFECHAGDVCLIAPGHKAEVVGNEPVELVDFQGMDLYAEKA